jgi:hypothetical protein
MAPTASHQPRPPEERGAFARYWHAVAWWTKMMFCVRVPPEEAIKDRLHTLLRTHGRMAVVDIFDHFDREPVDWMTLEVKPGAFYVPQLLICDGLDELEKEGCAVLDIETRPGQRDRYYYAPTGRGRRDRTASLKTRGSQVPNGVPA